jgi:hypothetical protein
MVIKSNKSKINVLDNIFRETKAISMYNGFTQAVKWLFTRKKGQHSPSALFHSALFSLQDRFVGYF